MVDQELSQMLREYMSVTQRLAATHEALEDEVQRLRRELRRKDQELERRRRLSALGEVAAGVAHEVRNPLGAIQLYSGLLREQCAHLSPALQLVEKIQAGIRSIESVVQNTLALAPHPAAPRPADLHEERLDDVLERAIELCADEQRARGVSVERTYADGAARDARAVCDPGAVQRALLNLLRNAVQASPAGGRVRVHVSLRGSRRGPGSEARRAPRRIAQRWCVRIRDDGEGLPAGVGERLFQPFFTTKQRGTGLGLSIAYRLIEAHGGTIAARNWTASRPRRAPGAARIGGAEFTVTLPLRRAAARRREAPSADAPCAARRVEETDVA